MDTEPLPKDQPTQPLEQEVVEHHHTRNLYPVVRHIFLVTAVLCALSIIVFLMYQNGKSIYDNGL